MVEVEDFFKKQLPKKYWSTITDQIRNAYSAVKSLSEQTPFLNVQSAKQNYGTFCSIAVDYAIERAIENGAIPCESKWVYFDKPTGKYLELQFSHSTASVSLVHNPKSRPRDVRFRENKRLGSPDLFSQITPVDRSAKAAPHFLLIHGREVVAPKFAHFGLPSAKPRKQWEWLSDNLMNFPHIVAAREPSIEDTESDFEEIEILKEEIERWRKDNGN